ncbi:CLUMA_CG003321, isoform A [Clunio marinus]|uniref:CLUMA_CG003321, isoform A n=1 Tax=Clunio marinus TaxID=568069 RepID=A0A1J1HNE8_9DIPT|nr:CLUMA_CG003321, isoform A [Clunio marinus]
MQNFARNTAMNIAASCNLQPQVITLISFITLKFRVHGNYGSYFCNYFIAMLLVARKSVQAQDA